MKKLGLYILYTLLLVTVSCSRWEMNESVLAEIDSLTMTDADSARVVLKQIAPQIEKASDDLKAYYNLLCVKADDKAGAKHASDSLISAVAKHFERSDDKRHLAEAYYYVGRVNSELSNGEKAYIYFQKALMQDSVNVSPYLKSRIYAQIGYVYIRNGLYDDALNMQELAHIYCKQLGDTLGMSYSEEDMQTIKMMAQQASSDAGDVREKVLSIQKLNAALQNQELRKANQELQDRNTMANSIVLWSALSIGTGGLLVALLIIRQRRRIAAIKGSEDVGAPPAPIKRAFYDKEISGIIEAHIGSGKVLKGSDWTLIEQHLLQSFPSFKEQLFSLFQFSETEYRICMLIKLEVSPSNIAKLLATGTSTVSQSRLRMQQKVFGSGTAKDWDNYVVSLG